MKIEYDAIKGLDEFLEAMPEIARQSASYAMNDITGGKALTIYRKAMRSQIAFPAGYLEDEDRFGQTGYATPARLETKLSGRQRPTSLARFATSGTTGKAGVSVNVKAGRTTRLEKAFLVRLNSGVGITADKFNLGLAVRVKPGETIRGKREPGKAPKLAPNVFLLYAPSVDQVFRTVADNGPATPQVLDLMALEFFRQFARLSK